MIITGDDADDGGHCSAGNCGNLFRNILSHAVSTSTNGGTGILAVGVNGSIAGSNLTSWNTIAPGPNVPVTIVTTAAQIGSANFDSFAVLYIPSVSFHTVGGINSTQLAALNARQADVVSFVNNGGSLVALTEANVANGWGWLPFPLVTVDLGYTQAAVTPNMSVISPTTTSGNLSHCCFHNVFTSSSVAANGCISLADAGGDAGSQAGEPNYILCAAITTENCTDGVDNDGDGLVDKDDPDCFVCGDGILDPNEECDDGNIVPGDGCDGSCMLENAQCVAVCQDVTVPNDPGACSADASIDGGSFDPDGDPISLGQTPLPPYAVGSTDVTLECTDGINAPPDSCSATVTVLDTEAPVVTCNSPATITPPDAPISFTGGGSDNCDVTIGITEFDCFMFTKRGKRIDKTESCVVSIDGDTITIEDSGGVGDHITWTVTGIDSSGNTASTMCEVLVENPGQGGMGGRAQGR